MESKELVPVEWSNQRVLTTKQLAQAYNCAEKNINDNFLRTKAQFIEGVHYFKLEGKALESFRLYTEKNGVQISPMTRTLYLWTYRGVVRHCKMINTDEAWAQFDELEQVYFAAKARRSVSESACVYAALMDDSTVKIGFTGDITDRLKRIKRGFGKAAVKYFTSPFVPRAAAQCFEAKLKAMFAEYKVEGEFFNVDFERVVAEIKKLPLEEEEPAPFAAVQESDFEPQSVRRLVEFVSILNDPSPKGQFFRETANLILGKEIF